MASSHLVSAISGDTQPRYFWSDVVLVGLGLSTAILTALVVALVALSVGIAIHLYFVWFVLPAGAFLCGMAAAAGYPLGALVIGRRPGRLAFAGMIVGGPLSFLLIFAFQYVLTTVEGRPVAAEIPFGTFVDSSIRNTGLNYRWRPAKTPPLGPAGYPFAALSLLGFFVGSAAIRTTPPLRRTACDRCARYMRDRASLSEYVSTPQLAARFSYARSLLTAGESDSAMELIGSSAETDTNHRLMLDLKSCDPCGRDYYHLRVMNWDTMAQPPWVVLKGSELEGQVDRRDSGLQRDPLS